MKSRVNGELGQKSYGSVGFLSQLSRRALPAFLVGVVALAACGDDSGALDILDTTPDTTATTVVLTADAWVAEADAICADFDERDDAVETPASDPQDVTLTDTQLQAWAVYFEALLPLGEESQERFAALGTPPEIADEVARMTELRDEAVVLVGAAVEAARASDNFGFRTTITDIVAVTDETEALWAELGAQVCGDGDTAESSGDSIPADRWTTEVQALCAAAEEQADSVPEPEAAFDNVTEADLPEVATYLDTIAAIQSQLIDDIGVVGLPEGAEDDATAFLDAFTTALTVLRQAVEQAEAGDLDGFFGTALELETAYGDASSVGQDLGVEGCTE